jgi:hypothetical protein
VKANFKVKDHADNTRTLYFSYRGRLVTVEHYDLEETKELEDDDWDAVLDRDARIFLRGFNYRE